jgi:hypothetical protein
MRRSRLAVFACVTFAVLFARAVATGQEQTPPQQQRAPEKFVVQVEYFKGAPLSYESVPGSSWYGRFAVTPAAATRAPADTVLAVDLKTRMDAGRVEIKVGVHVGAQQFDRLDEVATYHANAGETVIASDLERFGVGPFRMKVLRIGETLSAAPTIVNRTQSIEAVVSRFDPSPLPRATITLRNLSSKKVLAVDMRQVIDGKEQMFTFVAERDGKILMEPGGTAEKKFVGTRGQTTQSDFTPEAIESIVVASAVFDDYTYEGDVQAAARKRAFDEGERAQLPRLVALLRETRAARGPASAESVKQLKEKLTSLDDIAPAKTLDSIVSAYPELKQGDGRSLVESAMSVSMHKARRTLLDDLKRFESDFARDPAANDFAAWLKSRRARFEQWLSRL